MRAVVVLAALALAGCAKGPDACQRLAARLMPDPDERFVEACRALYESEPRFVRTVDCLLAVEGGLRDEDIKRCPGSDKLPLYFHF